MSVSKARAARNVDAVRAHPRCPRRAGWALGAAVRVATAVEQREAQLAAGDQRPQAPDREQLVGVVGGQRQDRPAVVEDQRRDLGRVRGGELVARAGAAVAFDVAADRVRPSSRPSRRCARCRLVVSDQARVDLERQRERRERQPGRRAAARGCAAGARAAPPRPRSRRSRRRGSRCSAAQQVAGVQRQPDERRRP